MIQKFLRDKLFYHMETVFKNHKMTFSVDYYYANDNTVSVYHDGGFQPDLYEIGYRYPVYQIWIRSSEWEKARFIAEETFKLFNSGGDRGLNKDKTSTEEFKNFTVSVPFYSGGEHVKTNQYFVYLITPVSDAIRIGVENDIMEYSINLDVTLTAINEDINYGKSFVNPAMVRKYKGE